MKHDVAVRWAEALESGEYEQCRGALCYKGKHCCLGVLCEVLGVEKRPVRDGARRFAFGEGLCESFLPVEAMELSGVTHCNGYFRDANASNPGRSLGVMNDCGESFASIAQVIRENWAAL